MFESSDTLRDALYLTCKQQVYARENDQMIMPVKRSFPHFNNQNNMSEILKSLEIFSFFAFKI